MFTINKIIRDVENPNGIDKWEIQVNDRCQRFFSFELSPICIHQPNITAELCKNGIMIDPYWSDAVCAHLLYCHQQCIKAGNIEYTHKFLGWHEYEDSESYFLGETPFNGGISYPANKNLKFCAGDRDVYLDMIRTIVLPSTELSLAMCIGYAAVVVSRLKSEADLGTLLINVCGESTIGKSTAEMLMCSPFAYPDISNNGSGLNMSAYGTVNAFFKRFEGVNGVPIIIDDITTNDNMNLKEFIYTSTQGVAKARLNGNSELREAKNWSGVVVTSSEAPIMDALQKQQGMHARVLHTMGIQWTSSAQQAKDIKRIVRRNYGFTGKEFADYVATIDKSDLYDRYLDSLEIVETMMTKKDRLSERLAGQYAAVHLTAILVNEALNFNISADDITSLFIKCEQDCFDERDNTMNAYEYIIDFVYRNESRFLIEREDPYEEKMIHCYYDEYRPKNTCGKIIKYATHWEVYILLDETKAILGKHGLDGEIRNIRKEWVKRGLAKGDGDHKTRKTSINGKVARCDCIIIQGGIKDPEGKAPPKTQLKQEAPVSDYYVDDTAAIEAIFGGENDENSNKA